MQGSLPDMYYAAIGTGKPFDRGPLFSGNSRNGRLHSTRPPILVQGNARALPTSIVGTG